MVHPEFAAVGAKALEYVQPNTRIGLGSGRTSEAFLHALADKVRQGFPVRGVATSEGIAKLAGSLGIPVDALDVNEPLDVTIDGADEVHLDTLHLIKGWGGALVRERIVAAASKRQIILVTAEKIVPKLGTRGKLPVEVIPFAEPFCRRRIVALGLKPTIRQTEGKPFVTDNGNWILDCGLGPIDDPIRFERDLLAIPGLVDTGLFLDTASLVLLHENNTIREIRRPKA